MADIRCPMCGKPNPAERETCQYCDARLKPLIAGQSSPTSGESESSDWLSGLRSEGEDFSQSDSSSSEDMGADDWLARLGGSEPERKTDEYGEEIEENTLPDWFTEAGKESPPAKDAKDIYRSDELPDWFSASTGIESTETEPSTSLESTPDEEPQAEQEPEMPPVEEKPAGDESAAQELLASIPADSSLDDWLASLDNEKSEEGEAFKAEEAEAVDFSEEGATGEPAPSLDWFTGEPGEQAAETPQNQELTPGTFGETEPAFPAFSEEEEQEDWSKEPGESSLPAWLTSNRPEAAAPDEQAETPKSEGEEPDWLARVRARQAAEQQTKDLSGELEEEQAAPELPDWLSSFSTTEQVDFEPEAPLPTESKTPPAVSPFTNFEEEGQQAFAWSSGGLGQPNKPGPAAANEEEADDTPEWLKSLHREQEEASAAPAFSGEVKTPDWLTSLGTPPSQTPGGSVPAFVLEEGEGLPGEGLPTEEAGPFPGSTGESESESIPDWLAQVRAEEEPAAQAPEAEPGEELERANLPTWLEAMRPVEAVAPEMFKDTSDSRVENAGPLAGLRGALPAEMDLKETHKPPPYSLRMSIPEEQAARLDLLKGLLAQENEPKPLPSPAVISSQLFMRVLVFVFLLAAALYAIWAGPQVTTQLSSSQAAQPVIDFQSRLAALQPNTPVLVSVDFEPGFTSELETSMQEVLNQLANRNSLVFTVSTSTSGAIQAERLLATINSQAARQQSPFTGLVNLGFLPGGPAGLLTFAADPANTIPVDIYSRHPWVEIAQEGEAGLASFAAVIIATDRAETARIWIEQIGPGLQQNGVSLLMVTSAQVEPLVQSYYSADPQLVGGFISGLTGGAAYENLVGQPGAASTALDAFSGVLLAGILAILAGGLLSLLVGFNPQPRETAPIVEEQA